jgi:hypothetical protein
MIERSLRFLACAAVAGALYGVGLSAQEPGVKVATGGPAREAAVKMLAVAGVEMERTITNAPFSAQATTTTTQVLADGNRIIQTSEMSLARDSEGRTRREMSAEKIGPWSTDTNGHLVVIRDPVALAIYELSPDGQHASKHTMVLQNAELLAKQKAENALLEARARSKGETVHTETRSFTYNGQPVGYSAVIVGAGEEGPETKEQLGDQTIEGVRATGTRVTKTIPAGRIGNERPIEIVSETWYSPDLQMIVQSKRSDPRLGETIYKLSNVVLGEPDPSSFQVPGSYTVRDEKEMVRLKLENKLERERQEPPPPPQP